MCPSITGHYGGLIGPQSTPRPAATHASSWSDMPLDVYVDAEREPGRVGLPLAAAAAVDIGAY
jgi:hypothetical protein